MIIEIPSSEETWFGGYRSEPYDPGRFGGLRREDWNFPTGCLWKDKRLAVGLIDDDQERLDYGMPYQIIRTDNEQFVLSSCILSLRCLWFEMMAALGRGDAASDRTANDHAGFSVSAQNGQVRISRTDSRHEGDCFRIDHIDTLEMSLPYAESLLGCVEAALRHGSEHYWKIVARSPAWATALDKVLEGGRPYFLPQALQSNPLPIKKRKPARHSC